MDEDVLEIARVAAGTFELYVCRHDDALRGREQNDIPELLKRGLVDAGVAPDAITVIPDEREAVEAALRMAQADDLLVLFADALARTWNQVVSFASDTPVSTPEPTAPSAGLPQLPQFDMDDGRPLVRDERGVRMARDLED